VIRITAEKISSNYPWMSRGNNDSGPFLVIPNPHWSFRTLSQEVQVCVITCPILDRH
jgi:hypothetical protein